MSEQQNSEVLKVKNSEPERKEEEEAEEEEADDDRVGETDKESEGRVDVSQPGDLPSSVPVDEAKVRESCLETLTLPSAVQSSEDGRSGGSPEISASQLCREPGFEEQAGVSHSEALVSEAAQAVQAQTHNQIQLSTSLTPSSQKSPTSVTQSISSAPSPTLLKQRQSRPKINSRCEPEPNQKNSASIKTVSSVPTVKTPASDGYNWRKYGQKQVKSPKGSRSYYRCTYSECCAKKIEFSDHSGHVTEVVHKSQHSHDPPRKINITGECKHVSSVEPVIRNVVAEHSGGVRNDSELSMTSKEPVQDTPQLPERKRQCSSDSDGSGDIIVREEHILEPKPKRRVKKGNVEDSGSLLKPGKKPKFVVHAAGDVGISGDGYRWRKYGQKMVKGNPHPRNYYRCTSTGCPVRKHIETAVDNPSAVIITYKGIHDHDKPVPKKRHGPPSAPLIAASAPTSMDNNMQLKKTDTSHNIQPSPTKWSVDNEGELTGEALDLGGETAIESARTLLSIGFEIKPC